MTTEGSPPGGSEDPGTADELPARLGFSATLAGAWRLYVRSLRSLAGVFVLVSALILVVHIVADRVAGDLDGSPNLEVGLAFFIPIVAYVALGSIGIAACGPLLADRLVGRPSSLRGALATSRESLRDIIAAGLFAAVIALCLVALFLPLAPLLFLVLALLYGPPVVAFVVSLEKNTLREALGRARRLLSGSWLRVTGILSTVALAIGLLKVSATQLFLDLPLSIRLEAVIVAQVVADALLLPFLAAVSFLVYVDLRVRCEGLGTAELAAERDAAYDAVTARRASSD